MRAVCFCFLVWWSGSAAYAQDALPPYPAPAPTEFASPYDYMLYSRMRLTQLSEREQALDALRRTDEYRYKRKFAFLLVAAGALTFGGLLPDSTESGDDRMRTRLLGVAAGAGAAVAIGAGIWAYLLKWHHPLTGEIEELRRESKDLRIEIKRARGDLELSFGNQLTLKF